MRHLETSTPLSGARLSNEIEFDRRGFPHGVAFGARLTARWKYVVVANRIAEMESPRTLTGKCVGEYACAMALPTRAEMHTAVLAHPE